MSGAQLRPQQLGAPVAARSLQARLTLAIGSVLGLTLLVFSALLYVVVSSTFHRDFDEQLAEDALVIGNMVEERPTQPWLFEPGAAEYLQRRHSGMHFDVRMDDGAVLVRSSQLDVSRLQHADAAPSAQPHPTRLPSGESARILHVSLPPRQDDAAPGAPSGRRVNVRVARSTARLEQSLAMLRFLLGASVGSALLLAMAAARHAIRRGLAPIAQLSERADSIDSGRLDQRLPTENIPLELRPSVLKLNELLARLQMSFERERQFTSDASHELRTPLAGLRSILEVSASRERSGAEHRTAIAKALAVVDQMHRLVEQLLLLARLDVQRSDSPRESIALCALLDECLDSLAVSAQARSLSFDNRVPEAQRVLAERSKLELIVLNLLRNAIQYADAGSTVTIDSNESEHVVLRVTNRGRSIPESALDEIFERFVRLESGRANDDGSHFGIGLALVKKLCEQLELEVLALNVDAQSVSFVVRALSSSSHA